MTAAIWHARGALSIAAAAAAQAPHPAPPTHTQQLTRARARCDATQHGAGSHKSTLRPQHETRGRSGAQRSAAPCPRASESSRRPSRLQAAESAQSHGGRLRRGAALPSNPRARWVTQGRQRPLPSNPGSELVFLTGTSCRRSAFSAAWRWRDFCAVPAADWRSGEAECAAWGSGAGRRRWRCAAELLAYAVQRGGGGEPPPSSPGGGAGGKSCLSRAGGQFFIRRSSLRHRESSGLWHTRVRSPAPPNPHRWPCRSWLGGAPCRWRGARRRRRCWRPRAPPRARARSTGARRSRTALSCPRARASTCTCGCAEGP